MDGSNLDAGSDREHRTCSHLPRDYLPIRYPRRIYSFITSGAFQTLVSLREGRDLFNTFYPAICCEVMRRWVCVSCEKNKNRILCRDL
jgi:hypothetical protein